MLIAPAWRKESAGNRIELTRRIADEGLTGEIILVSDGSTDATAETARRFEGRDVPVTVIEPARESGQGRCGSIGTRSAIYDVIVFADVRQRWADDALARLLENFADDRVGAVSGELFIESAPGVMAGVGLYWRYEKALRRWESLVHSTVGVTGAIAAVRRTLFRPIPSGTVLDDVYWPLCVALRGDRVVFDGRACSLTACPTRSTPSFAGRSARSRATSSSSAACPKRSCPGATPSGSRWCRIN